MIKKNDDDEDENYFSDFLKLYTFEDININPKRQKYYSKYFLALGNIEEFLNLQPVFSTDINEDNVIDKLLFLININKQQDITTDIPEMLPIQNIINFISTHFEQIDKEKMKRLDNDIIERIINNKNLKLHDEDSLVTFLLDLYSKNSNTSSLFEYVIFNNLSKEMIEKFVNEFDIEYLNSSIWKAICQRLIGYDKTSTSRYIENSNVIQISLKNNDKFDGIFQHLNSNVNGTITN
ncbi:hypothetical protein M9Y10_019880 [Tritrichomonas musculus]|uniref:Uncharacterized protein n=1 Tax=Tritrichomonas musculus TaxID=1915356 RepID=A0ABR2HIK7_9EUKA